MPSRRLGHDSPRRSRSRARRLEPTYRPRVVVKFRDDVELPYDNQVDQYLDRLSHSSWRTLTGRYPGIVIRPMTNSIAPSRIRELSAMAARLDTTYHPPNFLTYYVIECPENVSIRNLVKELSDWPSVQTAYHDPPGEDPVTVPDDPRMPRQGYLDAAPYGIDAKYAWGFQGGDGAGQHFVDLEQGWTLDHQDLAAHAATVLFGTIVDQSRPHGTSVLGIVCAAANQLGGRGIAPAIASVNVVTYTGNLNLVPNAIDAAIVALPAGGVILLEVQKDSLPTELLQADFDKIRLATALGFTVVECAGNGGFDLDNAKDPDGKRVMNPGDPDFRDSGAIVVGAATSKWPHERMSFSNFGLRVDCYAWGENVDSTTSTMTAPFAKQRYTRIFNGTSSAAPIIAGAALVIQGMTKISLGSHLGAQQMRTILRNPATGTPTISQPGPQTGNRSGTNSPNKPIGVMPDLRAIIDSGALGVVPPVLP